MRFGGPLPWVGPLASRENLHRTAVAVERFGYEWVTAGEHLLYPKNMHAKHPKMGHLPIDPASKTHEIFTLFAWLAALTTSLRFMSSMLIVPYRSPFVTAKLAAELDWLSGGRFTLGAAVGWMYDEFEIFNVPFEERGRLTDEYLAIVQTLFSGDGPFEGDFYSFPEAWFEPKPMQKPLPVVIGGLGIGPVFRRVVKYGNGWWPWPLSHEEIAVALPELREMWAAAGRDSESLEVHASWTIAPDDRPETDAVLQHIANNAEAGVTHLSMRFGELGGGTGDVSIEAVLEAAEWFAEEVVPGAGGM